MKRLIDVTEAIPEDAIGNLNGLFYKIGLHNFSYYWNGDEWLRSQKPAPLIEAALKKCRHKFSLNNEV
mgnify:FL=1